MIVSIHHKFIYTTLLQAALESEVDGSSSQPASLKATLCPTFTASLAVNVDGTKIL